MSYFMFDGGQTMPIVTPKLELLVDLSKPVEEILDCILLIANSHPGKQLEILQKVDFKARRTDPSD
jgi:hypothetical protein